MAHHCYPKPLKTLADYPELAKARERVKALRVQLRDREQQREELEAELTTATAIDSEEAADKFLASRNASVSTILRRHEKTASSKADKIKTAIAECERDIDVLRIALQKATDAATEVHDRVNEELAIEHRKIRAAMDKRLAAVGAEFQELLIEERLFRLDKRVVYAGASPSSLFGGGDYLNAIREDRFKLRPCRALLSDK